MKAVPQRASLAFTLGLFMVVSALGHAAPPENVEMLEDMKRLIEAQQEQLKAQQRQLREQSRQLEGLKREITDMKNAKPVSTEQPAVPTAPPGSHAEKYPPEPPHTVTKRPNPTAEPGADPDWPGSIRLPGTRTRMAVGGFVKLDIIHDTSAITSPCDFVTADIVTRDASKAQGSDGQTNFCAKASRFHIETRTPTKVGRVGTFLSLDFFGSSQSVSPDPRLRQAWGELTGFLFGGDLRAGQAWSTFIDPSALPQTLDFEGPGSSLQIRQPLLRWSKGIGEGLDALVAVETPNNTDIVGADMLTRWPNAVLAANWNHPGGHLKAATVIRDLRASANNGATKTALGWGFTGSGRVDLPFVGKKDNLTFQINYGQGIGSYFDDSPPDAVFDSASSSLEAIPVFGAYAGLQHWWMSALRSSVVFGYLDVDNRSVQAGDALNTTQFVSANLVWSPFENADLGGEYLWGKRKDLDGARGTDNRIQFSSKFNF